MSNGNKEDQNNANDEPFDLRPGKLYTGKKVGSIPVTVYDEIYDNEKMPPEFGSKMEHYHELCQGTILLYVGEFENPKYFYDQSPVCVFLTDGCKYLHMARRNVKTYLAEANTTDTTTKRR